MTRKLPTHHFVESKSSENMKSAFSLKILLRANRPIFQNAVSVLIFCTLKLCQKSKGETELKYFNPRFCGFSHSQFFEPRIDLYFSDMKKKSLIQILLILNLGWSIQFSTICMLNLL